MERNHWIERMLTPCLKRAAKQFPAVLVSGARQVGKTALCRHVWPQAHYVSLDIPSSAESARYDPLRFLSEHPTPLIVDEVQYAPELLRYVKARIDEDRTPGQYLLTGSQDFAVMQGVTETLAGRCAILRLPTLGIEELEASDNRAVDELLWRGGWPELHARPELDRELWLGSYLATYLERDVRNILNVGSLRDFDRFLRAAAYRAGQLVSFSEIARDVGVALNTVRKWVSVLEASHQIVLLEPWFSNEGKRLIKTPKLYFRDTGLLIYLLGFRAWKDVRAHAMWGAVWENAVVAEFHKAFANRGLRQRMWFWRTVNDEELDLIVDFGPGDVWAFEIKASEKPEPRDLKGFGSFAKQYGETAFSHGMCICRNAASYPLSKDGRIRAVPLAEGLSLLAKHGSLAGSV